MQAGKGSATLSMAYAAAKFAEACLKALSGDPAVVECAFVASHLTELPFFASRVRLGPSGVEVTGSFPFGRTALFKADSYITGASGSQPWQHRCIALAGVSASWPDEQAGVGGLCSSEGRAGCFHTEGRRLCQGLTVTSQPLLS